MGLRRRVPRVGFDEVEVREGLCGGEWASLGGEQEVGWISIF